MKSFSFFFAKEGLARIAHELRNFTENMANKNERDKGKLNIVLDY
jgi:hypothetical protein